MSSLQSMQQEQMPPNRYKKDLVEESLDNYDTLEVHESFRGAKPKQTIKQATPTRD